MTNIKVIIFSFLLLLFLSCSASAFEDTVERYPTGSYTDYWTSSVTYGSCGVVYNSSVGTNVIKVTTSAMDNPLVAYLTCKYTIETPAYVSFITRGAVTQRQIGIIYKNAATGSTIITTSVTGVKPNTKYEFVWGAATLNTYANGTLIATQAGTIQNNVTLQYYQYGGNHLGATSVEFDDFTTSSVIGLPELVDESDDHIMFTWSAQLLRSYSENYSIKLYSLSNVNNAGLLKTWDIGCGPGQAEFGIINVSRAGTLQNNYGLYLLEITRGSDILEDQYFYYDQLSNPQGFPELLFLAESSVKADIRDDDNNGGEIAGGESVYLYPDIREDGVYNFTCDILETPYAISTEIRKVYNTTSLNGSNIHYSGLSSQNYNISVDGEHVADTNGADTWDYSLSWDSSDSHVISFNPDFTKAGVWGEVKNSKTQKPIKSASVAITGVNNTTYLYTDDNGMYYLTKGMEAGKTYNLSVTKTGYAASNPALVTTTEGATTRTDFYLDPTSGEGLYYAPHSVTFTVLENWYNYTGLPGIPYSVYDNSLEEEVKAGSTDSKGQFTVKEMDGGTNYTITLSYNGRNITEYVEPGLSEYTFVLNEEGAVHTYFNNWLTLSYAQNSTNATVTYSSNKTLSGASLIATASNGTITYNQVLTTQNGSFFVPFSPGDYSLQFHIEASDGSEASQVWTITNPATVNLFPTSYPAWLKNTLFTALILIFLLAFGKSKNDIACGSVAVLTSLGYFFKWLTCSFNFVVLVWIIAAGAIYLHYKRTGAVG